MKPKIKSTQLFAKQQKETLGLGKHSHLTNDKFNCLFIQFLCKEINMLIISENIEMFAFFLSNNIMNEEISNLDKFCFHVLDMIQDDLNGIGIIVVDMRLYKLQIVVEDLVLNPYTCA